MSKSEGLVKKELKAKVKALKKKAEEFRKQGDLSRAEHCSFLAQYLEEVGKELNLKASWKQLKEASE